jgi:hypothetical protein
MSSPTPPRSADAGRLPDRDYDPERLSMVGYNDIEMVPKTIPSLTTISPARRRDGRVTSELFLMIDRNLNCVVAASMASAMASWISPMSPRTPPPGRHARVQDTVNRKMARWHAQSAGQKGEQDQPEGQAPVAHAADKEGGDEGGKRGQEGDLRRC